MPTACKPANARPLPEPIYSALREAVPAGVHRPIVEREIEEADGKARRVDLDALIANTRTHGYTTREGHLVPGVWSASAPVLDSQGEIVAGLTIVGNANDGKRRRKASTAILIEIAAEASAALGSGGD